MAEPIKHDGLSSITTAGAEVAKWSLVGFVASAVVGALVVGGALVAGAGIIGSFTTAGAGAWMGSMLGGGGTGFTVIASILGAVGGGMIGGTAATVGGGLFGALKGAERLNSENAAYRGHTKGGFSRSQRLTKAKNDGEIKGMQEGYMMGFQEGQAQVVSQLQQMAMAEQQQMMHGAHEPHGKHTGTTAVAMAQCEAKCVGPETEKIIKRREAQAIAGPEVPQVH